MTHADVEYRVPARAISQIRDIITAAEAAIQELITQCTHENESVGPKEREFYRGYCQLMYGGEKDLEDIF